MKRILALATILLICGTSLTRAQQQTPPSLANGLQQPLRIQITQQSESQPSWIKWTSLVEKIAWPVVAVLALIALHKPFSNLLDVVGKRATGISFGGLEIKLPTMNEAQLGDNLLTFRHADALMVVDDSAKKTLFNMFRQPGNFEFVGINLGNGTEWLSSRLYLLAVMLPRMKSLRCIVFLAAGPDTETQFIGTTTPERVRWGLARLQPWLEVAYPEAYQLSIQLFPVQNNHGRLDPNGAEEIARKYLTSVTTPAAPIGANDPEWVALMLNKPEHSTWVSREYLENKLAPILWRDRIGRLKSEKKRQRY